jgi:hypothetical protein
MSARLLQRVLKEREPDISATTSTASEEESDSSPKAVPARNPFDLLDDEARVFYCCLPFLSFDILEKITQSYLPMLSIAHLTIERLFPVSRSDFGVNM